MRWETVKLTTARVRGIVSASRRKATTGRRKRHMAETRAERSRKNPRWGVFNLVRSQCHREQTGTKHEVRFPTQLLFWHLIVTKISPLLCSRAAFSVVRHSQKYIKTVRPAPGTVCILRISTIAEPTEYEFTQRTPLPPSNDQSPPCSSSCDGRAEAYYCSSNSRYPLAQAMFSAFTLFPPFHALLTAVL